MDLDRLGTEVGMPREVYALLAQANLLRMRGHWEEAAQKCMEALRLAPDSSSTNSLLGDIYENQGRYDDAAQWYRMALDINPNSPADVVKLERLSRRGEMPREQQLSPQISRLAEMAPPRERLLHALRDPEKVLRYGAIAAALGLTLIVACAYMVVHHAGRFSAIGGDTVVNSPPVVVPPLAGVLPADPDNESVRDPSEQSLLTALQASHDLSALGITVYDVQVDPRAARTTITFGLPSSLDLTQEQVMRDSLQMLQAAAASGPTPQTYTVRCLLVPSGGTAVPALAFVGDASQEAVQAMTAAGEGLTDAQAAAAFTNVWWSLTADVRA
jgi:tetratricopeptide (TPR) repeat protein